MTYEKVTSKSTFSPGLMVRVTFFKIGSLFESYFIVTFWKTIPPFSGHCFGRSKPKERKKLKKLNYNTEKDVNSNNDNVFGHTFV